MISNGEITDNIFIYAFKFAENAGDFIFKSQKKKEESKMNIEDKYGSFSAK